MKNTELKEHEIQRMKAAAFAALLSNHACSIADAERLWNENLRDKLIEQHKLELAAAQERARRFYRQ